VVAYIASDAAHSGHLLSFDKKERSDHVSVLMVECMVSKTNNLSSATKNREPHFQRFAIFLLTNADMRLKMSEKRKTDLGFD
jgi:hypothetical protein